MPLEIFQVEITSRCSMACNFCPHSEMTRAKRDMPVKDFQRIAVNFHKGQRVGLYMMGDPLLHLCFTEIVWHTIHHGAIPEIATNSLALTSEDKRRAVLLSGIDLMILDISRHKERPEVMDKAIANAHATVLLACKLHKDGIQVPKILLQIVRKRGDHQEFHSAMVSKAFRYPEVVKLHSKFLDTWAGHKEELIRESHVHPPEFRTACAEPWNRVAVLQNGDVVPCCRDAFGQIVYGNLMTHSLEEIEENSPVLRKLRKLMLSHKWDELPEPCRSCREWHIPMDRLVGNLP